VIIEPVPAITPLKGSIILTAFDVTAMTIGMRIGYTMVKRVPPMIGNTIYGVYVRIKRIGMQANNVRNGFTFAFRGFKSSIAPIIPAIAIVPQKLTNTSNFSGTRRIPIRTLIVNPIIIATPPISGTSGRLFLCASCPTIPLLFISSIIIGRQKKVIKKLVEKSINLSNIDHFRLPKSAFKSFYFMY
jgi:hypothetical protein